MRVAMGCVLLAVLWQEPSSDTKKPADDKSAGQAQPAGDAAKSGNPAKATPESLAAGKKRYSTDCEMCHGKEGAGDGDLAADMKLKLKDFRDEATLKDLSDKDIFDIIDKGKGQMMGEEGRLKPEQIWNVVNYVRGFAKKS
jgi:mono/diheme cytochrome c family protein